MKAIKDIAAQAGVSKTSVYNLIKKKDILTFKKDGKTYIDERAENLIIAYYSEQRQETLNDMLTDAEQTHFQDNFQPVFEDDFQDKNNIENHNGSQDKNQEHSGFQDDFQPEFQADFQLKREVENAEILAILKSQIEEKDKTIQALINVIGYEKNYQTAKLLAESNSNKNIDGQNPPPNKKGFFARLFRR